MNNNIKTRKLAIVVPCYKEEAVLHETTKRLSYVLDGLINERLVTQDSFILYINDGSKDKTWPIIVELHHTNRYVCGVNLAGNVGHQNALLAGLTTVVDRCDIAVSIDADLQDDVNAIREMIIKYNQGNDIVYGVRSSRKSDSFFKRFTAQSFYKIMQLGGAQIVFNHADYRLMSKRALQYLLQFQERNLFLRGIVPLIGYNTDNVYYERAERFAGESKYPLAKMLAFAFDGITSFSVKPLHMVFYSGLLFILVAISIMIWILINYLNGKAVPGWSSMMISIWFCSGCILVGLGIVGEYIGKIYIETKNRPHFNIESTLLN